MWQKVYKLDIFAKYEGSGVKTTSLSCSISQTHVHIRMHARILTHKATTRIFEDVARNKQPYSPLAQWTLPLVQRLFCSYTASYVCMVYATTSWWVRKQDL